jgi:phage-related protein
MLILSWEAREWAGSRGQTPRLDRQQPRGFASIPRRREARDGLALRYAQGGEKHPDAKPLKGYTGAGVLEIVASHVGNAYRAVYTVRFAGVVYVLHAFQKKSRRGIATPPEELATVNRNLKRAEEEYARRTARP